MTFLTGPDTFADGEGDTDGHDGGEVERLARAAAAGDRAALDRLLLQIRPLCLARARQLLVNPLDVEEAAQDAMLAVARQIHRFEGRSRFTTWLYQVCSNAAFDTHRRLRRRRSMLGIEVSDHPSPQRTSVVAGTRVDLLEALSEVDGRLAQPVVLRDVYGLDYATIAVVLGVPVGTVKSRLHEGRRLLTVRLRAE